MNLMRTHADFEKLFTDILFLCAAILIIEYVVDIDGEIRISGIKINKITDGLLIISMAVILALKNISMWMCIRMHEEDMIFDSFKEEVRTHIPEELKKPFDDLITSKERSSFFFYKVTPIICSGMSIGIVLVSSRTICETFRAILMGA